MKICKSSGVWLLLLILAALFLSAAPHVSSQSQEDCKKDCSRAFSNDVKSCNEIFKDSAKACSEAKKTALEQCKGLKGLSRSSCVLNANLNERQCKTRAENSKRACMRNALDKRNDCFASCRNPAPVCGNGIIEAGEQCDPPGPLDSIAITPDTGCPTGDTDCSEIPRTRLVCDDYCQIVQDPLIFVSDAGITCNIGFSVFGQDRSPNSTGITKTYNRSKNMTRFSQFQNWTSVPRGNMSCVPTLSGVAIKFWNSTLPGLDRNISLYNVSDRLHRLMRTNETTGTTAIGFINGITRWINLSGYAPNMSITIRGNFVNMNTSIIRNGVNVTGIIGSGDAFNPLSIRDILEEFISKNEFVMLAIEVPGGFHVVAIHSISDTPNANGNYDVALMDPATGEIVETEIEPDGDICTKYDDAGVCEAVTTLQGIFSISIKND